MSTKVEREDVKPGDWALHVGKHLDAREVTKVRHITGEVWLFLLTTETGPFPLENYTYTRPE